MIKGKEVQLADGLLLPLALFPLHKGKRVPRIGKTLWQGYLKHKMLCQGGDLIIPITYPICGTTFLYPLPRCQGYLFSFGREVEKKRVLAKDQKPKNYQ